METITAIKERRSVKHYDPVHEMSEAEINALLELALLSPTSFNMQNWRFVVVTDPEKRAAIQAAAWNQAQVTEASITIALRQPKCPRGRRPLLGARPAVCAGYARTHDRPIVSK